MNKRRLLKLADLLEADAKNKTGIKFDLGLIARKAPTADRPYHEDFSPREPIPVDCGTAACAVGLACISGAFAKSGLSYSISRDNGLMPKYRRPDGKTFSQWTSATTAFFGITPDECQFLFTQWRYPVGKTTGAIGERYVAKRIRNFVAGKVAPQ